MHNTQTKQCFAIEIGLSLRQKKQLLYIVEMANEVKSFLHGKIKSSICAIKVLCMFKIHQHGLNFIYQSAGTRAR